MIELFAAVTGVELGKLVLEQVLNLGKSALEDYVKDFFKDCIQSGVARANAETLKEPMAEAVGFFIKRFIKELQFNDVPETSIEHHFKTVIRRFVKDKAVRPILDKAFEKDCKQIDYAQLQDVWTQQYQVSGWEFPTEDFDWRGVAKEYVVEVKGIIKADAELRSILNTQLLEDIAHNTAQISPGFDVDKYRESLQCSYGYLKLYTLDSTDRADTIKLWNMFIEQTVREALPPTRYELPLDLKRQLQEQGQLDDLSPEALEHYHQEYFQQPARKVLEAVAEAHHAVILGDPGSGKSTVLQYLALDWVEGKTETLPLLIELREYVMAQSANFLDFLHRGRGADWQFDERQLHQYLLENPSLVMFDGLDEVFDRPTQAAIVDDMIRFAQQYPQAKVLVTSRIIGYNPERFQHAGFQQFTIQPLHENEIHEFIDRWYDLAMGSDSDKVRLKQRLKDAIANSKAIANLADNPLLLTMMAILNRRQELPRDRADLYDQASRVLLYHWDVDHKRLQLPMDAIGRREKQEMLRLIAYEMQAGEEGLKGNLIGVDRLTRILTDYLRDQGFSEPREKANQLIQQLRERNFILCYRGADSYGFVHRTFLEYFCAVEIVQRFEKQRSISFEELRNRVFGEHWQDETWHEVLRLICAAIDSKFSEQLIEFLLNQKINISTFLEEGWFEKYGENRLKKEGLANLLLAVDCYAEVKTCNAATASQLLQTLKQEVQDRSDTQLNWKAAAALCNAIAYHFKGHPDTLSWLKQRVQEDTDFGVRRASLQAIAYYFKDNPKIFSWFKGCFNDSVRWVRLATIEVISSHLAGDRETLQWLIDCFHKEGTPDVLEGIVEMIAKHFGSSPDTLRMIQQRIAHDENYVVRDTLIRQISEHFSQEPGMFDLFCEVAQTDRCVSSEPCLENCRKTALNALLTHYPIYPRTLELLHDRAINDPDEQLREWAQQQLEQWETKS